MPQQPTDVDRPVRPAPGSVVAPDEELPPYLRRATERHRAGAGGAPRPSRNDRPARQHQRSRWRHWPRRPWLRNTLLALGGVLVVLLLAVSVSIVGALRTPGNESFKAKWADWLRAHHGQALVTLLEDVYFTPPPKGGTVTHLNVVPSTESLSPSTTAATHAPTVTLPPHLPRPADIPLVVQPATADEGVWQPTGLTKGGVPGMYVAQFRADTVYTSQITTAVWIDPTLLRVRLVPGAQEPGGDWPQPPEITGSALATAVAAFNGGFRFQDAKGGFYLDGRTSVPLREGAASVVIHRDGHIDIGAWGSEVTMAPDVEAVLQNLTLMVDHGVVDPSISHNDTSAWGSTLKGSKVVARSGIGVTANGALVYVAGPALTAKTLAESLQRAGAVRAMTLDINPEWVTFNLFTHPDAANPSVIDATKLYPQMERPARRYLSPESRDFFTVSLD